MSERSLREAYQAGWEAYHEDMDRDCIGIFATVDEAQEAMRGYYDAEQWILRCRAI